MQECGGEGCEGGSKHEPQPHAKKGRHTLKGEKWGRGRERVRCKRDSKVEREEGESERG